MADDHDNPAKGRGATRRTTKRDPMLGYDEAFKIDVQINALANKHPIDKDTWRDWYVFTRTLQSTLYILQHEIEKVMKDNA